VDPVLRSGPEIDPGRRLHGLPENWRDHSVANPTRLGLDDDRTGWIQPGQGLDQPAFKGLLAGLRDAGQASEDRAPMSGQTFEIEDLQTALRQSSKDFGLGAAGIAIQQNDLQGRLAVIK